MDTYLLGMDILANSHQGQTWVQCLEKLQKVQELCLKLLLTQSWQLKAWLKLDGATGEWSQGVVTVQLKSRLQPNWNVVVGA